MNYSFEDYETAILSALDFLKAPKGYLKTLKGYAGEFDEEKAMETFLAGFPGILVEVIEASYEHASNQFHRQEALINLYLGARSWRGQDEARKGDVGVSQMLTDARDYLLGKDLGMAIRPLLLLREYKLGSSRHTVLYAAEYQLINDRIMEVI